MRVSQSGGMLWRQSGPIRCASPPFALTVQTSHAISHRSNTIVRAVRRPVRLIVAYTGRRLRELTDAPSRGG
jgi:hypothetical protein